MWEEGLTAWCHLPSLPDRIACARLRTRPCNQGNTGPTGYAFF